MLPPANLPATGGLRVISDARDLTGPQKAAIAVRLLLADGIRLPLERLPEALQSALAEQIATMPPVSRGTVETVARELADQVAEIGLSFPDGLDGALTLLEGHISAEAAGRLRSRSGGTGPADPWPAIAALEAPRIAALIEAESVEIAAVTLSRLPVPRAAEVLGLIPGARARRIAYAVSQTGAIAPEALQRIGLAIAEGLDDAGTAGFDNGPVEKVGAILNFSPAATRDDVLQGLEETDAAFADQVRKAIFTFTHIPTRIDPRDVPKIIRGIDQAQLVMALAGAKGPDEKAAQFLLANISQRMAGTLRDEIAAVTKLVAKDVEAAQGAIVAAIRALESQGELFLVAVEDEA
jgi:flagellar motor switch protein FliG